MGKPRKHKRKGPKSTRAGCLMCNPHKDQAYSQRDTSPFMHRYWRYWTGYDGPVHTTGRPTPIREEFEEIPSYSRYVGYPYQIAWGGRTRLGQIAHERDLLDRKIRLALESSDCPLAATFNFPGFDDSESWGEPIVDIREHLSTELDQPRSRGRFRSSVGPVVRCRPVRTWASSGTCLMMRLLAVTMRLLMVRRLVPRRAPI